MGALLGLVAATGWGFADFAARFGARRLGAYRTLFFMQVAGAILLSAALPASGGALSAVGPGYRPWALGALAGLINAFASLALYHSFEVGVLAIVAPISASYPAVTVALAFLSGERLPGIRAGGLAVTFLGVILAAVSFRAFPSAQLQPGTASLRPHASRGVGAAVFSGVGFGVMFWFLGFHVVALTGSLLSVWIVRVVSAIVLGAAALPGCFGLARKRSLRVPSGRDLALVLLIAALDSSAFVANNAGLRAGPVSVVSVLASLYGAVTVLLSWIFLRERLERTQWLGIALIFAGIILVGR